MGEVGNRKTLLQVKEAVAAGSARRCNAALDCKFRRCGTAIKLHSRLKCCTAKAANLLGCLASKASKGKGDQRLGDGGDYHDVLSVEETFRALLFVDPSYTTPWVALCKFASICRSFPLSTLMECVSLIEDFLMQQFTARAAIGADLNIHSDLADVFPEDSPGAFVLQFARKLTDQYLILPGHNVADEIGDGDNDAMEIDKANQDFFLSLISDLLCTTVRASRESNSITFNDQIFVTVHLRTPPPARSIAWLRMAYELRSVLSGDQMHRIGRVFLNQLCAKSASFAGMGDPSSLVGMVVDLANPSCSFSSNDGEPTHDSKLWRTVLLYVLYQGSLGDVDTCGAMEECVSINLSEWGINALECWIAEIKAVFDHSIDSLDGNHLPSWFVWNAIAVCLEALDSRRPWHCVLRGSIGKKTLMHAFEGFERDRKEPRHYHSEILEVAFGRNEECETSFDRLHEMQYAAAGLFTYGNGVEVKVVSSCGYCILQSLFLGKSIEERQTMTHTFVSRAYRLIYLVDELVTNSCDGQSHKMSVFAASVKTVAYYEVPEFRKVLIDKIREDFDRHSKDHRLTKCHMSTVSLIFAGVGDDAHRDKLLEPFCDLLVVDMESSLFADLIHTLGTLSTARAKILLCSQKMVAPQYAECIHHHDASCLNTPRHQRLRHGLLGLLQLIRRDEWTPTEVGAWRTLSDIIVLDLPPISLPNRIWLYGTFERIAVEGTWPRKATEHLVRAFTIRLGSFLDDDDDGAFLINRAFSASSHKEDAGQKEDVLTLHRLLSLFLRTLATVGEDYERRSVLLAHGREAYLRSILVQRGEHAPRHRLIANFFKRGLRNYNGEPDTFALCWCLFLEVNFKIMTYLCCGSQRSNSDQQMDSSSDFTSRYLIESIQCVEREELEAALGVGPNSKSPYPSWLSKSELSFNPSSERLNVETNGLPRLKAALFDLLIELLFIAPFPANGSDHFADPLCWKVVTGTGVLIGQRQKLSYADFSTVPANDVHSLSTDTIFQTAESFLSVSSTIIRDAIHRDCTLIVFEELIVSILVFCDALYNALLGFEERDCSALIYCLWDLYQSASSESASLKLIHYMESHLSENGIEEVLAHDRNHLALTIMRKGKDVDDAMQEIRLRCLRPLQSCFSHVAIDGENDEKSRPTVSVEFLGGTLAALAKDLQVGLNGNSGGITPELFLAYCGSIEECSTLIFDHGMTSTIEMSVVSLFSEVAATLTSILFLHPLRDAVLFRTTFILAAAVLPSMSRDLLRRGLCVSQGGSTLVNEAFSADSVLLYRTLDDSVEILARWGGLREPCLVPWGDIAGSEHAETDETELGSLDKGMNFKSSLVSLDESQASWDEIPRIVHVPSPLRIKRKREPMHPVRRIRIHNKEVWSWALSCSLLGLEQKWLESQRTINAKHIQWDQDSIKQSSYWSIFYKAQKEELQKSLVITTKFLNASADSSQLDDDGNQVILDVLATNLPSAPRLRLCCAIEGILRVLVNAINHVHSCLVEGRERSNVVALNSLSFFEAFCCLSAWLSTGNSIDGELSTGIFKWLAILSRKHPPGEATTSRPGSFELISRVSQLSELACELHSKLKLFQSYLKRNAIQPRKKELNFILNAFFDRVSDADDNHVFELVSSKFRLVQKVIPREFKTRPLPYLPFSRHTDKGSQEVDRKRTRPRKTNLGVNSSKRGTTKNRNKVVNMFMDLDQDIEPSERRSDAFADLEDFLVEG